MKKIIFISIAVFLTALAVNVSADTGTFYPAAIADDCGFNTTDSEAYCESEVNSMGKKTTDAWTGAFRFVNVTIPKDSTITTAYVTFQCGEVRSGTTCNLVIDGEDTGDAATFIHSNYANFSARGRTTASVDWDNVAAWGTQGNPYNSPSIITVIDEITSHGSWTSGNDLALFFADNGSDADKRRRPYMYDFEVGDLGKEKAALYVEWTPPAAATGQVIIIGGLE